MSVSLIHVVKLGGSLLDLPDLLTRFERWREAESATMLLVVGGGAAADVVRDFDRAFSLDESIAHWLAIRAMRLNAEMLASVMKDSELVENRQSCEAAWKRKKLAIMEPVAWLEREANEGVHIPHRWTFTSDSIAAHAASRLGARRLTLLKSTLPDGNCDPEQAAGCGIVDADFPAVCSRVAVVEIVNLREHPPARCDLKRA